MPHAYSETWAKYYKDCEQQPDEELAGRMLDYDYTKVNTQIARVVYESRQMKRQHEYQVKQIELQNAFNSESLKEQIKTNKKFLHITVIATISASILGAVIGGYAQFAIPRYFQKPFQQGSQQTLQPQKELPTSASHPGKTTDKVPLSPPK
jgi:hypothetical protein